MPEAKLDLTDELLVAYVDDELDVAQRAMVSAVLDSTPALFRRAEEMRLARDLLREAFPLKPEADLPESIDTPMSRLAAACAERVSGRGAEFGARSGWRHAIAAGVALLTLAGGSYLAFRDRSGLMDERVTALTQIDPDNPLFGVLESRASSELIRIPGENATARAILTFRAKDGRICREFEILSDSGGSSGVACRGQDGWRTEVLVSNAPADVRASNYYTPAGASDTEAVSTIVDRLMQGDAMSAEQEARVLADGWRTPVSPNP